MANYSRPKPAFSSLQKSHPLAQGLVAFPSLAENSGVGTGGNSYSGIFDPVNKLTWEYYKSTVVSTDWVGSPYGAAINFTDTTSTGSASQALSPTLYGTRTTTDVVPLQITSCSVMAILNLTATTVANACVAMRVVSAAADPYIRYGMQMSGGAASIDGYVSTGGAGTLSSPCNSGTLTLGQWYVVVMTFDQANIRMYVDGILKATTAKAGAISTSAGFFHVGGNPSQAGNQQLNGKIAGVAVWNRALSQMEVAQLTADPFECLRRPPRTWIYANASPPVDTTYIPANTARLPGKKFIPQRNVVAQVLETIQSGQGGGGHNDPPPKRSQYPYGLTRQVFPNKRAIEEFPWFAETSIQTPLVEATQVPPRLFIPRQPNREVIGFLNTRDLPPEIDTTVIEATLFPDWILWKKQWRRRNVMGEQSPGQASPSSDTPLIESTLVPGWKFRKRQPQRAVEGFNPFLPPLLRTCEIITLFTTNYRKANPNPMMPVARITRIYRVKGLVEC